MNDQPEGFLIENLLFVIPVIILAKRANRNHPRLLPP
jgi:hypothetical protein